MRVTFLHFTGAMALIAGPLAAVAQAPATPAEQTAAPSDQLVEIIVTAQRREEDVQHAAWPLMCSPRSLYCKVA